MDEFPELSVVCAGCRSDIHVPDGVNAADVSWLHSRRCEPEAPTILTFVECPACDARLTVQPGLDPLETVWLHEDSAPLARI